MFLTLVLAVLMAVPQRMVAQQPVASTESEAQDVSYTLGNTLKNGGRTGIPRIHNQRSGWLLKERRNVKNDLLQKQAPIQITSEQLRAAKAKASRRQGFRVPYIPDNNNKHVIVNVIYNSMDETMDEGLFDLDVVTGELTFLSGNFIEDYENYGFNGGGYIFNGKYRGVYYDSDYDVSESHQATVMEFDMDTWEITDLFDIPYMSTMALETATQYNADGTTSVLGQFWGVDREGKLSLRYATLDDNGTTTTSFGQAASKHMLAMGVTSDGRLYGVAKDGNLYEINRTTGKEICVGHTDVDDIVDYEGNFWLQTGEIDPHDNTFYWMAEHAANYWTQLFSVDLTTGKATSLIDFAGDVECAGMVIAKPQRKADTPASVTDLTVTFGPLDTTGTGSFVAPTTNFAGEQLDANSMLYYNLYVNNVKQTVSDNQVRPGATVNYSFNASNIQFNSENVVRVTVSATENGEESVSTYATAWQGYGIPQAPKNAKMTYDNQTNICTITWEAPITGAGTGVKGGYVDKLRYNVYRLVDGERTTCINGKTPLSGDVLSTTYTLTNEDKNMTLSDLSFGVEACVAPSGSALKDLVSDEVATNSIRVGKGKETPYYVDIANNYYKVNQKDFTIINSNNDDRFWVWCPPHYTGTQDLCGAVAAGNYHGDTPMDDWFITPGIALEAGKTYHYRSYVHGPGATVPWYEHGEVWIGTDRTAEAMTVRIIPTTPIVDYMYLETDFTVPEDGNYYFGTHSVSEGDNFEIALFDIYVGENTEPEIDENAPAAAKLAVTPVYGITETVGADGKKLYCGSADITVTLPTRKASGAALTDSDLLDVTVTATDAAKNPTVIAELNAQTKGAALQLKAENLPSGMYTFSVLTKLGADHTSLITEDAYVGWDNAVAAPTGMKAIHKGDNLVVQFEPQTEPKGANGAYLPAFSYRAYGGSKAAQLSYYADQGFTYVYDVIEPDGKTDGLEITAPDLNPNEGGQYNWLWYVAAVSKDAQGANIYSKLVPVRTIIGAPMEAPVIETGNQEYIIDAEVDNELAEVWNYYLNRGQVVCGVTGIEDQFGSDYGQSWNIFSAFNGTLTSKFGKVAVADLTSPVFGFDIILEDTDTGMEVELNGPEGKQAVVPLTVKDGVQHINIPLDQYKSWGWVQPSLKAIFNIAHEGDRIHDIYVDNVGIYDLLPCNLAITGMTVPAELKAGEETIVNVSVMNLGQQTAKNYTVTLFEDEVPVESQTFAYALQPGESNVVQFYYRANTIYADDIVGQEEAEKVLTSTVEIDGDANEADNMGESTVTIVVTGGKNNTYPTDVVAQMETEGVNVSWSFDFEQTSQVVTETFEDYETWYTGGVQAGAPEGQIGVWKLYDVDNKPTYTWAGIESMSQYNGAPQAFQVFYPDVLLYTDSYYWWNLETISGEQFLVSMDPSDGNYTPKPDDWLISPRVPGGSTIEFYYGALTSKLQGGELLYSETGQDISDFKLLKKLDDVSTSEWQFVFAKLPETAKYFAIRHNKGSYQGYGMKIDDITYNMMTSVDHFNIYVDGKLVGTADKATYLISTPMEEGKHKIGVTAVYADGTESVPAYATIEYVPNAIREIVTSDKPFDVYSTDGKVVRSNTRTTDGLKGVYVIGNRKTVLK